MDQTYNAWGKMNRDAKIETETIVPNCNGESDKDVVVSQRNVEPVEGGRELISAFVIAYNEEDSIERCLKSLSFCDEIVVIDSFSTDRTCELASRHGAKVFKRVWTGYRDQKAFGLEQVSHSWVLNIDADEEVGQDLKREIQRVLCAARAHAIDKTQDGTELGESSKIAEGYEVNRVVYYQDRFWRSGGWYPEYRLRFFQKQYIKWGGTEPHERPELISGRSERLGGELYHYTYRDLNDQIDRLNKFSSIAADEMFASGKRVQLFRLLSSPVLRFMKFFVIKKGYREGVFGFIIGVLEGYYTFLKYAKLWEKYYLERKRNTD